MILLAQQGLALKPLHPWKRVPEIRLCTECFSVHISLLRFQCEACQHICGHSVEVKYASSSIQYAHVL